MYGSITLRSGDISPPRFSAYNTEKLGGAWGRGYAKIGQPIEVLTGKMNELANRPGEIEITWKYKGQEVNHKVHVPPS